MTSTWCAGGGATDQGPRARNEDAYLTEGAVHIVADGMGGHLAGAAASGAVVDTFRELAMQAVISPDDVEIAIVRAKEAVDAVSREVGGESGTTLTGAVAVEHEGQPWWMVVNIGDSRTYLVEGSLARQITVDHSRVQQLIDLGEITPEQAHSHPDRNIVTRAIGDGLEGFDAWLVPARPGLRLVSASDGLTKVIDDHRIGAIASLAGAPAEAAVRLVDAALAAGTNDNVTVTVVDTLHAVTAADAVSDPWRRWDPEGWDDDDTTLSARVRESV